MWPGAVSRCRGRQLRATVTILTIGQWSRRGTRSPGAKMCGGVTASRQQSTLLHTDIFNLVLNTDQLNNWK